MARLNRGAEWDRLGRPQRVRPAPSGLNGMRERGPGYRGRGLTDRVGARPACRTEIVTCGTGSAFRIFRA